MTQRRVLAGFGAGCLSMLAFICLAGHERPGTGPTLLRITDTHGINRGDLPVLIIWGLGLLACLLLSREP
ncbi:hypothetical protein [Nocardioides sp.]|uniref:hypothetical protein n=1 Tax=Nocardioides sp. TaxID=35761 RepID=UPI003511FB7F